MLCGFVTTVRERRQSVPQPPLPAGELCGRGVLGHWVKECLAALTSVPTAHLGAGTRPEEAWSLHLWKQESTLCLGCPSQAPGLSHRCQPSTACLLVLPSGIVAVEIRGISKPQQQREGDSLEKLSGFSGEQAEQLCGLGGSHHIWTAEGSQRVRPEGGRKSI